MAGTFYTAYQLLEKSYRLEADARQMQIEIISGEVEKHELSLEENEEFLSDAKTLLEQVISSQKEICRVLESESISMPDELKDEIRQECLNIEDINNRLK